MVKNNTGASTQDLLSQVGLPPDKPVTNITDEQALALLEATDPLRTKRTTAYYTNLGRQWWISANYYLGHQNLQAPELLADVDPGILMQDGAYVANHIVRMVMANVSRRNQNKPGWQVVPLTPDQPDQDGAKVAEALLDHAYEHTNMDQEGILLDLWLDVCGTAFRYATWDKSAGVERRIYLDPRFEEPTPIDQRQLNPQQIQWLEENKRFVDITEGDWEHEVLSPFQVILIPTYTTLDQQPHVRIDRIVPLHRIWDRWPDKAPHLSETDVSAEARIDYLMRLTTTTGLPGWSNGVEPFDGARLRELWIRPSKRCPQGRTIVGAGETILENLPHRFKAAGMDKVWPIVDYHNIPVPGRFHSMSTVEHLIGPQRDYNRGRWQMILQRDFYGTPQWMAPRGTMDKAPIRNEFGDWWEYDAMKGKPELASPPPMSTATIATVEAARGDMQIIAAQSDATQARTPEGVRSGLAINALQEQDMAVIGPTIKLRENSERRYGELLLQLAWKNMTMPRAIALYGESRQADVTWFRGSDIRGNTKIRVIPGSMMPRSKTGAKNLMLELIQVGAMNPGMNPGDRRAAWKVLEVGGSDLLFQMEDLQRRRAKAENMMFARPPANDPMFAYPDIDVDDDPAIHVEEHVLFKQTDEYERMPPLRKQLLNAHIEGHREVIAQMIQAQMALQQTSASSGGEGGPSQEGSKPRALGKPSQPKKSGAPAGASSSQ